MPTGSLTVTVLDSELIPVSARVVATRIENSLPVGREEATTNISGQHVFVLETGDYVVDAVEISTGYWLLQNVSVTLTGAGSSVSTETDFDLLAQPYATQVTSAERTAGTETELRAYSPEDIAIMAGIHAAGAGINNVVEDVTPQLGGNLDLNGNVITGLVIGTNVQAYNAALTGTTATFTTADETKLDGIESLADVTDETNVKAALDGATIAAVTPVSGDFFLIQDTSDSGNLRKVNYDDLPSGGGGGLSNIVEDVTPQLGGPLDVNGSEITGAIDLHSTGNVILELGDAAGVNGVSIRDSGAVEVAAIDSDGNITTSGTVDGRDIATDGTKLDGIESGATADQSNAEIRAAVEAATDSNVFTDADHSKLDGIEAGADVTDETNVKAALDGATIAAVTPVSGDFFLVHDTSDSSNLRKVNYDDLPGAGGGLANIVEDVSPQLGGPLDVNGSEITGAIDLHSTGDLIIELGDAAGVNSVSVRDSGAVEVAAIDSDGNITTSGTVDGRDLATDGTKLDGIETGADVTDAANVNTAGAVMESDYTPARSILAQQSGTGSPTAVTLGTDELIGRTTGAGTDIQGLSAAQVRTLLNVEDGATADQSNAEIRAAVEAATDSNVFTDADHSKLDGIEAAADVTDETNVKAALDGATIASVTPVSGDFFLIHDTSDASNLRKVNYDDLPGAGGGLANLVEDLTPQLGGPLDVNGSEITGAIDLHSTGDVIIELGDAAGVNGVSIRDSGAVEVAAIDSDGNITTSGTVDGRDLATDGTKLDGIEALADVTDATNVTAAGAVMDSEVTNLSGIKTLTVPDSTTISTFAATLTDDTTAAAARATLGVVIGTDVQAFSSVLAATTASFLTADETKLDGIEALADVTDETNVKAALDGATISAVTPASTDRVLLLDASDTNNLRVGLFSDFGGGGGGAFGLANRNDSTTETLTETTATRVSITTATITKTLPALSGVTDGASIAVSLDAVTEGTGSCTIARGSTDTINWGGVALTSIVLAEDGDTLVLYADADNSQWRVIHDGIKGPYLQGRRITSDQTLTANTYDIVEWNEATQDYHGLLDTSTNVGRITPTIPGVYLIESVTTSEEQVAFVRELKGVALYKNGAAELFGSISVFSDSEHNKEVFTCYFNGSTDYFEILFKGGTNNHTLFAYSTGSNRRTEINVRRLK